MAVDGNRFAPVTPDNHAGSIWIAALICLVYSCLVLALRVYLRRRNYGIDDSLAFAATLAQVAEVVAVIVSLNHGLGQTEVLLPDSEVRKASQAAFASQLLFIIAACLAKLSTFHLMMRLFNLSGSKALRNARASVLRYIYWGMILLSATWGIVSIIALCVNCSPLSFIRHYTISKCPNQVVRWQVITAIDVATELLLVLLVGMIVFPVQLKLELKLQVVFAFAFRLIVAALALAHLHYVQAYAHAINPGIALVPVIVLQQVALCWSLISATIPNLKSFVKSFGSGFGIGIDMETYAYGSGRAGYELGSVKQGHTLTAGSGRRRSRSYNEIQDDAIMPSSRGHMDAEGDVVHSNKSTASDGSQEHIIRKDVQWNVRYEHEQHGRQAEPHAF